MIDDQTKQLRMNFDVENFFNDPEPKKNQKEIAINAKHDLEIAKANLKVIKAKKHYAETNQKEDTNAEIF